MGASSPLGFWIRTGAPRQVPSHVARRGSGPRHDIVQLPLNLLNGVLTLFGALIVINHKNINLKILKSTS